MATSIDKNEADEKSGKSTCQLINIRCTRSEKEKTIMDLFIKLLMLIIFFGVMIGIGLYCRKHATDVNGFVLGGRDRKSVV